ncbi:unnamed protein product [Diamesa hyperborea]
MSLKCAQSDDAKTEYANQLQKSNKLQLSHYQTSLPTVFNRLQEIDEKRTQGIKEFVKTAADVESSVAPIIARCLEGIVKASDSISEKEDTMKVIERYQSGFQPPGDIPFEDLSKADSESSHNSQNNSNAMNHNATMKGGTMGANKLKKRVGIFNIFSSNKKLLEACINVKNTISADGMKEDYSDLPPSQRKKKLLVRISEIQQKIQQEQGARDGLIKMKGVYESNTFLGDPQTVQGELKECEHKLEKLKNELRKYQILLEEVKSQQSAQHSPQSNRIIHQNGGNNHRSSRHSNGSNEHDDGEDQGDDGGSLSRSASENNVAQNDAPNGLLNINNINDNNNNGSSASPESGLGTSHSSLPGSGQGSTNDQHINDDMYYDTEPLQPLGTCKALYPFDATSEGSIPMAEGEELHVIELDQGDGWTRVRRIVTTNVIEEGFVPTSYIESTLYA